APGHAPRASVLHYPQARGVLFLRETALATLIHQRRLTPLCGGQAPTAERTVGPASPAPGDRDVATFRCDASIRSLADVQRTSCALMERAAPPSPFHNLVLRIKFF